MGLCGASVLGVLKGGHWKGEEGMGDEESSLTDTHTHSRHSKWIHTPRVIIVGPHITHSRPLPLSLVNPISPTRIGRQAIRSPPLSIDMEPFEPSHHQ
jgi:hypothetical protein